MQVLTGTSGFSYPAWRGSFYPAKLSTTKMLAYYAGKLDAVEINNTFYPLPPPPPNRRKDLGVLAPFLAKWTAAAGGLRAAFEFRDESWLTDDVYAALARHD